MTTAGPPPSSRAFTLFRTDSPADVLSAGLVVVREGLEPAAFFIDAESGHGDPRSYLDVQRTLAGLVPCTVVDATGLGLASRSARRGPAAAMFRTLRLMRVQGALRGRLRDACGPLAPRVSRVFLAHVQYTGGQILANAFRDASISTFPHSFASLQRYEIAAYASVCGRSLEYTAVARLKMRLLGADAALPIRLPIDEAYSFALPAPWARHSRLLAPPSKETLVSWLHRLPQEIQQYAASFGNEPVGLIVLAAEELAAHQGLEGVYKQCARELAGRGVKTVVVKPHFRSSEEHARAAIEQLAAASYGLSYRVLDRFTQYPIELLSPNWQLTAVAGPGSTALVTLARLHHIRAIFPAKALANVLQGNHFGPKLDDWAEEQMDVLDCV